jgi:hypothetical protein
VIVRTSPVNVALDCSTADCHELVHPLSGSDILLPTSIRLSEDKEIVCETKRRSSKVRLMSNSVIITKQYQVGDKG